jgi:hypothetical protein
MLSIMSIAYQGAGADELPTQMGNSEERRKKIVDLYVEQMGEQR